MWPSLSPSGLGCGPFSLHISMHLPTSCSHPITVLPIWEKVGATGISISQQSRVLISSTVLDKGVINGDIPVFSVFLRKQNSMFLQIAVLRQKKTGKKGTF